MYNVNILNDQMEVMDTITIDNIMDIDSIDYSLLIDASWLEIINATSEVMERVIPVKLYYQSLSEGC